MADAIFPGAQTDKKQTGSVITEAGFYIPFDLLSQL